MPLKTIAIAALSSLAMIASVDSSSATTVVGSSATFDADTSSQVTTGFGDTAGDGYAGYPSVTENGITFTGAEAGTSAGVNINDAGVYGTSGNLLTNQYDPANTGGYSLTIDLGSAVTAFGLDFGTDPGSESVSFLLSNGFTYTVSSASYFGSPEFLGFLSSGDPFDTITLTVTGNTGWGVLDVVTAASDVAPTPLPAALPMFAGGLGIVGFLSRRKKRKADMLAAA
jgi:hypothetical protein